MNQTDVLNGVKTHCMKVENQYPSYKSTQERERLVQKTYEELQRILYHKSKTDQKNSFSQKEQSFEFRKGY